ncbi:ninein isoform X2 [Sceloporus undulatus]|uniref:ninein isoform X2 n=1 Tax=Sceloporus undulatus TaxID=8520 RepID=UPI001C4A85A3|nr:ninein isoform X2 [Sceloporus undulatus]
MDEAEQDQYEAHLKELFDSFDVTGTGSLGQEELTELCHVLHLEEVAPGALQQTLLQDGLPSRVHFDQFKDALILILSSTLTNEESFQEPDSSPEAQPKYIKGGKRYGRRSLPEFQKSVEEFAEVTVIEPLNEEGQPSRIPSDDCDERWRSQDSEEYEAEGQLRFWNPDDLNASPSISPTQDWIEEKLCEVCANLGISRDGHLSRKKLVSICEQYGLQNIDTQVLEEIFHNLERTDGTMSIEDFFYGLFKIRKPPPPSASTPYRQLKRHLSMQAFDETGRRTTVPSAMTSTISFRVFSNLDDGMGYAAVEQILDAWHEEGIENSHEILKALDFSLDGKINLAELTLALENELLVVKNGIYQAALASFKTEIRHLMERADQVVREKEKLRLDLEKAEKLTSLMASEVDDHHAAIERQNEYNLSKLDDEYKERVAALKNELQKDREQIQHQASKQRTELEQEMEKLKTEENYLRDRLALTLKENSRLEKELLETGEKAAKYESMMSKLQKNWENVLAEKFGDLDPGSAEFFLQEERLMQMKNKYEQQCRELQDQIDELQSQLEEYQAQGRVVRPSLKNSLYEELGDGGVECGQEPASEDCNLLNMSIEAEMVIEQMKDQHHRDLCNLQQELENTMHRCKKQVEEAKALYDKENKTLQQKFSEERQSLEQQVEHLQAQVSELQGELARVHHKAESQQSDLQVCLEEEADHKEHSALQYKTELQARLEEAQESFSREKEELVQARVWLEEKMRGLAEAVQKEKTELENGFQEQLQQLLDQHTQEKEEMQRDLVGKHQQELQEQRAKMESEFNRRISLKEEQFAIDRQGLASKYGEAIKGLEERYQREMQELSELQCEEKSQWEFEKDEIVQDGAEAQERWKEMLEKERSVASALAQEKNLLEKNFKEYVNSFLLEKEQLQKELQDMKKQEDELRERLLQTETSHEQELKKREEQMSIVEGNRKQALQKIGKLETEFAREKKELSSRLVASEQLKQEELRKATAEQEKLRSEISTLESRVEELQQELQHLSKLQGDLSFLNKEGGTLGGDSPGLDKSQEPREVVDLLSNQEEFQALSEEGDVEALSLMGKLLKKPARELTQSSGFTPLVPDSLVDSQLIHTADEDDNQVKADAGIKKPDESACSVLETEGTTLEESMEASLVLEKTYEEMRAENQALRAQQALLQERISLLEAECDRAAHDRQDMASQVQKELDEILKTIPQPNALPCGRDDNEILFPWETADVAILPTDCTGRSKGLFVETLEADLNTEEISAGSLQLEMDHREAMRMEKGELKYLVHELWDVNDEKKASSRLQPKAFALSEELKMENQVLKAEMIKLFERNNKLEGYLPKLISLQCRLDEADQESLMLKEGKVQLLEDIRKLEEVRDQLVLDNAELQSANLGLQSRLGKLEEFVANLKALKGGRHSRCESAAKEVEAEKKGLHELNRKLREKIAALLKQKGTHAQERVDLNAALHGLQSTCAQQRQKLELMRCEAEHLREENAALKNEIALLNEKGSVSNLRLRELNGSQEELWHKIGTVQKEKVAVQKMAENFKKQASELRARNHQLELENAELGRRNPPHQADIQDLNQQLRKVFRQREKVVSKCAPEEWGRDNSQLKEELENCKIQSSTLVSSLETELSQLRVQAQALEQENNFLKEELEKVKQLPRCPDLSDLQNEISNVIVKNEKLLKEKEALNEELNRCVEKLAKAAFLENLVSSLNQEKTSLEHQNQSLKTQIATSQEKSFEDAMQNVNHQMSWLRSDLRLSQQEKEALEQDVMSLHKQLQTANDKNRVLEVAMHSSGLQNQQKKLCWDELDQLVKEEQQLLRQENERLQREVQSAKADLAHSREKVRQLESTVLTVKHQKHQSQSGIVKAIEQEKVSLKRECERLQKELTSANRKISQMTSLERELQTINLENEGLRKKQVRLDEQVMELLHSSSNVKLSLPPHPRDLQQQGCAMVSWEQYQQLQQQFLQAERRCHRLQEALESRPPETNMPQSGHEQLLKTMEKRMMDVEQQLRLVKRLLQDKVNQLKEQLTKNRKANEMVKDLYVENAQLLKALEITEQRHKTVEKKNYLLEEKIANLSRIVNNLTSPTLGSTVQLGS